MRSTHVSSSKAGKRRGVGKPGFRLLLWAAVCSLLVGATNFGSPVENLLRDMRNIAREHPASGEIVIVAIDEKSLRLHDKWPWPRANHAVITDRLRAMGAKAIFFDVDFSSASDPANDGAFEAALKRAEGRVTLPVHLAADPTTGKHSELLPLVQLREHVQLGSITVRHNFRGEVRELFYGVPMASGVYSSFAARMAGVQGPAGATFPIDFAIVPSSIPSVSASDVLANRAKAQQISGKTVLVAATGAQLGDKYVVPGHGVLPGAYLQALGAETLMGSTPVDVGWLLPLLLGALVAGGFLVLLKAGFAAASVSAVAFGFMLFPIALEDRRIFIEVVPALVFLLAVSGCLTWVSFKQFYRARGSINAVSGLPNLNVLRQEAGGRDLDLIVAKIHNYAEITSALSPEGEEKLVKQISHRLSLVSDASKLYQSDEGIFAWLGAAEDADLAGEHLDAAFEMFRNPMLILGSQVDATVTFGIDGRKDQPLASRLGSAVVAADDAVREGLRWKQHDPARSDDIAWKLSLLSQLDQAIDAGDLWIAFQPKMDVATRKIIGAEALARWNHPEKGPINPIDFILAAEQSGRIGKLTDYVLAHSIEAAARVNRGGAPFNVAVNLSARLIDGMALAATVSRLLSKHALAPECLTLEITETAALAGRGRDLEILKDLRTLGVQLAIDDYGTGLSTLDYLKRIPATEIKIDKSFVEAIEKSRSDRLMVHSTIQLAHSLGQKVVAEGVERPETLEMLALMGCDVAQGYLIGRPVRIQDLERSLARQSKAA
ncbi:MAG TPA: EAL domain-containing protein [Allosphingosinicella sp.]|jgi:EAL domain-containing protein (putative c-di-GMP-specific phosphodiesterase class I)/CHASE2 domain-containing sensor protein